MHIQTYLHKYFRCSEEEIELIEVAGEENDTEDSNEENGM